MDLITKINRTRFLGPEFLLWLWHRADVQEGRFGGEGENFELYFDSRIVLESQGEIRDQSVIKSETPTDTPEAREALRTGKLPMEAKLRILIGQNQWTTTFKAEALQLSGTKVPALLAKDDEEALHERMHLMEELEGVLEALYSQFLQERLDDDVWREHIGVMRAWVSGT
jgi:hypothetical protein